MAFIITNLLNVIKCLNKLMKCHCQANISSLDVCSVNGYTLLKEKK